MIKLLGASEGVELKVGKTLSVKSKLGKYQGLLLSEPGISLSYDGDNEKTLDITQEDIIKAAKFVDKKKKTPVLSGINISSTHICATDKFIATLKGQFSPENITISNELVEILKQIQFSQINYSGTKVRVVSNDFTYFGNTFEAQYPNLGALFVKCGQHNLTNLGISNETIKETVKIISKCQEDKEPIITLQAVNNEFTISSSNFQSEVLASAPDFEINLPLSRGQLLADIDFKDIKYIGLNQLVFIIEDEWTSLLVPMKK